MIQYPKGETVQVYRPTATSSRYGDTVDTYPDEPTHEVGNCAVDPGGSIEDNDGRTAVVTTPKLYRPGPAPDIRANDQIVTRGLRYTVTGEPHVYVSPFTDTADGTVIDLERVDG